MQTEAVILTQRIVRVHSTKASCRVWEPWWGEIESLAGDDIKDATLDIRASAREALNWVEDNWDVCINVTTRNYRCIIYITFLLTFTLCYDFYMRCLRPLCLPYDEWHRVPVTLDRYPPIDISCWYQTDILCLVLWQCLNKYCEAQGTSRERNSKQRYTLNLEQSDLMY